MKKLLCTLLCALLIISVMPAFARTTDVMTVVNCNEYVSLRQTNSTSASVLRKVHLGEFVTNCIKHDDQFTYCEFDGACGFILTKYLKDSEYTMSDGLMMNQMVYNCEEYVSLRKEPDTSSERLVKVPKNAVVTSCVTFNGNWVLCEYKGHKGYVLSKYLKQADYDYIARITPTPSPVPATTPVPYYDPLPYYMTVVNCSEWASLREKPFTSAKQLLRVPLGAQVEDCAQVTDDFIRCVYDGVMGYIRADMLADMSGFDVLGERPDYLSLLSIGDTVAAFSSPAGYSVLVQHNYTESTEELMAVCYNSSMQPLWSVKESAEDFTEISALNAFIAGTNDASELVIYNSNTGFTSYAIGQTKTVAWQQVSPAAMLSGGLTACVEEDGTIYASGYYSNNLICLNSDGSLRWRTLNTVAELYWPFKIELAADGVNVYYDSCNVSVNDYKVYLAKYSFDGTLQGYTPVDFVMEETLTADY